jgi:hypothetical protein
MAQGMMLVDRAGRVVWINEPDNSGQALRSFI